MAISGWLAIGRMSDSGVFQECGVYERPVLELGIGQPSIAQTTKWIHGLVTPLHSAITHGALMDSKQAGRALVTWPWNPPHRVIGFDGASFPPQDISVTWEIPILQKLAGSRQGGEFGIDRDALLGTLCGRPLVAALELWAQYGTLIARASIAGSGPKRAA